MKVGAASLAGVAMTQGVPSLTYAQPSTSKDVTTEIIHSVIAFDNQLFSQIDPETNQIIQSNYWGIPSAYASSLIALQLPVTLNLEALEKWAEINCTESCNAQIHSSGISEFATFEAALAIPVVGVPNFSDLIGKTITTLLDGNSLDLSLDFLYDSKFEMLNNVYLPVIQSGHSNSIAVVPSPDLNQSAIASGNPPPPNITMYGWKLQFRGPETHKLGSCVTQPVNHFNVEVFRQNSKGGWDYIMNAHIGTYISGGRRCFVLWNNVRPIVCWKVCSPTWTDLKNMFVWIIASAAAIAGITLAAWIIEAIAAAAATAALPVLLLL